MNRKTRRIAKLIFFVAVVLIAGNVYASYRNDISAYNDRIEDLDRQLEVQKNYSKELDAAGDEYMSQENVVRIARETLGLVKSGEKFFKNYNDNQ
ncbi:MAG: septum formation initiator family protein [Clostridia bacterium]|nr:septum formation initiator family protein [Clostridia bacterium]